MDELILPVDGDGRYAYKPGAAYGPDKPVWSYAAPKKSDFYAEFISGAHRLPNGNTFICAGPTGTIKWKGQIYGAPRFTWLVNRPVIYHGVFGQGLFQSIYPTPQSDVAAYLSSIEWLGLTLFLFVLSFAFAKLAMVPYFMFGGTFAVALSYMMHARIEPKFDTIRARLLVAFLALVQPWGRGWARYFTWLKYKRTPQAVIAAHEMGLTAASTRGSISRLNFWSEKGVGREKLGRPV